MKISMEEKRRNERLKELYLQRNKAPQNEQKPPQMKLLTQEQMDEINEIRKLGYSREEAVALVLKLSK